MKNRMHDPSPEEIRKQCLRIRERWTERQHWVRAGYTHGPRWTVPLMGEPRLLREPARSE